MRSIFLVLIALTHTIAFGAPTKQKYNLFMSSEENNQKFHLSGWVEQEISADSEQEAKMIAVSMRGQQIIMSHVEKVVYHSPTTDGSGRIEFGVAHDLEPQKMTIHQVVLSKNDAKGIQRDICEESEYRSITDVPCSFK
jgi:hypothetical protein